MPGTLYLIPVPLGPTAPAESLPANVLATIKPLTHFVVEQAKTARAFLKAAGTDTPLQELTLVELNEHTKTNELDLLLAPLRTGHDVGLLSEAGCPAVADPGANLVGLAQKENIRVVPLIGPSSLLLALMASGLNGQRFAFQGYLPAKEADRSKALKELESESRKRQQTQIFIETPYRNRQMFDSILQACQPGTRLAVATDLTLPGESVLTRTIQQWKKQTPPEIERRPSVFLLLA
ncbi:SAM-dependent methyltransferase [Dechloromonas denitrificans]|uniref:SAM-dependent methyltransferase n=1 Tax=Dechloromonas denitrificans TaxID=281362 RepID=UPI001CF89D99|nr:SAM-dependent methyltransferase [Dechloromonas denitrificans]UCV01778.1 SAM-dependent methyltransferase [Dechloromonas denitrificans]UCV06128.1 SAM-dependent methyltransferase [Dechloromonas denitrificans]